MLEPFIRVSLAAAGPLALVGCGKHERPAATRPPRFLLVAHGGARAPRPSEMTPADDSAYRPTMAQALRAGYAVLQRGGPSLDAGVATITAPGDRPLSNPGKGAAFPNRGT